MCVIDLEPCEVWHEKNVKARKEHKCSCCDGLIRPGEHYTKHFSVFEGDTSSEKMCMPCTKTAEEFMDEHHTRGTPRCMYSLVKDCIWYEEGEENQAMADKWQVQLDAMDARKAAAA